MMGYGIRTGKHGTRLAVLTPTVTEKQRIGSRITMIQMTSLANKTALDDCSSIDPRT